jgi:hypothetical protein
MSLQQAEKMIAMHDSLRGADRLRWLGCGTERYDMNLGVLEAAQAVIAAQADAAATVPPRARGSRNTAAQESNGGDEPRRELP